MRNTNGVVVSSLMASVIGSLLVATIGVQSSFAYIPPASFLIKNLAAKRKGLKSLKISSNVVGFDSGKPTGVHFKTVTIYEAANRSWRSSAYDDSGAELFSIQKRDGAIPLSSFVLFVSNPYELSEALGKAEIPVHEAEAPQPKASDTPALPADNMTLKRWNGSIAWVIGSGEKSDSPQFWIEKDSFLPVRLIAKDQDVQYAKYRYSQDLPYPRLISLSNKAGELQFEESLNDFTVNSASVDKLLIAKDATSEGAFTPAGDTSPSAMKDLIRKYYYGGIR
jgi:hypothetical protein